MGKELLDEWGDLVSEHPSVFVSDRDIQSKGRGN